MLFINCCRHSSRPFSIWTRCIGFSCHICALPGVTNYHGIDMQMHANWAIPCETRATQSWYIFSVTFFGEEGFTKAQNLFYWYFYVHQRPIFTWFLHAFCCCVAQKLSSGFFSYLCSILLQYFFATLGCFAKNSSLQSPIDKKQCHVMKFFPCPKINGCVSEFFSTTRFLSLSPVQYY